jgi:hypothetical protein
MKDYDKQLDEFLIKIHEALENLMWTVLDFIFFTKLGHFIFNLVLGMGVMLIISLFLNPEIRAELLIGAFLGVSTASIIFAWKDKNNTWV